MTAQKPRTNTLPPALCVTHQLLSDLFSAKTKKRGDRSKKFKAKLAKQGMPDKREACMRNNTSTGLTITCLPNVVDDLVRHCICSNLKIQSLGKTFSCVGKPHV